MADRQLGEISEAPPPQNEPPGGGFLFDFFDSCFDYARFDTRWNPSNLIAEVELELNGGHLIVMPLDSLSRFVNSLSRDFVRYIVTGSN